MSDNQNSKISIDDRGNINSNNDDFSVVNWPENIAVQTGFYHDENIDDNDTVSPSLSSTSSLSKYHLTHRIKRNQNSGNDKEHLVLYHSETKYIFDIIDTNDIIGVELEIKFANADAIGANPDDREGDFSTRDVGIHNNKSKERSEGMAKYEKELGKRLLIKGNMDINMDLDMDMDSDVDVNVDGVDVNNDAHDTRIDRDGKAQTFTSESAAYLNIYCYPRSTPRPGLIAMLKNKCSFSNHDNKKKSLSSSKVKFYDKVAKDHNVTDGDCDIIYDDDNDVDENKLGHRYEKHRRYKLFPTEDFSNVQQLILAIRKVAKLGHFQSSQTKNENIHTVRRRNYLVIVNPFSGTKKGKMVYETTLSKMLKECGVDHDVVFTERPGHALECMQRVTACSDTNSNRNCNSGPLDVSEYDAIVAVGGDGILSEILNGLAEREDYSVLIQRLKIGIVGCGTCNGLAASVLHEANEEYGILESIFLICKGQTSKLDLSTYRTKNETYLGFLTMSWAMISNIDIDSECIRFLGIIRNDIWGAWLVFNLKSYRGKFSYLPANSSCDKNKEFDVPRLTEDIPSDWVTIEDEFVLFWASQVSHAASNVLQSPESKLSDGVIRIWVVRRPVSRIELAGMLVEMESGKHVSYGRAEFFDCKAFRLTPMTQGSYNVVDGEVVQDGVIQGEVQKRKINLFSQSK